MKHVPKTREDLEALVNDPAISLGDIDPSNIKDMSELFCDTDRTDFSGIEKWDMSKVESIYRMFYNATSFRHDLSAWKLSKNVDDYEAFYNSGMGTDDLTIFPKHCVEHYIKDNLEDYSQKQLKAAAKKFGIKLPKAAGRCTVQEENEMSNHQMDLNPYPSRRAALRYGQTKVMCLSPLTQDGKEAWTKGEIYDADFHEKYGWKVKTNNGDSIYIKERFPVNELEDIFLDLYMTVAQLERDVRLEKENKHLICVYRDTVEAHGNDYNIVDIEVSDKTLRDYVARIDVGIPFEEYMKGDTAEDNEYLVDFLKQRNEFVLPLECAARQELVSMILDTNKYANPEDRISLKDMNNSVHDVCWDDFSLVQKIVTERLGQTFKAPDSVKYDLGQRLKLCFAGKFDELKKYKEEHRKAEKDKSSAVRS